VTPPRAARGNGPSSSLTPRCLGTGGTSPQRPSSGASLNNSPTLKRRTIRLGTQMVLFSGPSSRLTRRHARLKRYLIRAKLWRCTAATANMPFHQRIDQFIERRATVTPIPDPGAGHTDSEGKVRDPTASSSRQRVMQSPDNDVAPTKTIPDSPLISLHVSDIDPDDDPWTDCSTESSSIPGGWMTSRANAWSLTPDGRPGSSGNDSRYSCTPGSPVPMTGPNSWDSTILITPRVSEPKTVIWVMSIIDCFWTHVSKVKP
jgi:hypothetical protein